MIESAAAPGTYVATAIAAGIHTAEIGPPPGGQLSTRRIESTAEREVWLTVEGQPAVLVGVLPDEAYGAPIEIDWGAIRQRHPKLWGQP